MPDPDRLPRGLRRSWRSVADAVRGKQPPPVVGDAMEKAIAQTLRHSGGLRWLPDLASAAVSCQAGHSSHELEAAIAALDRRAATGIGGAFVDAAWSLVAEAGGTDGEVVIDQLATRGLRRMIGKLCIGPIEPDLVPSVFPSSAALRGVRRAVRGRCSLRRPVAEVDEDRLLRPCPSSPHSAREARNRRSAP